MYKGLISILISIVAIVISLVAIVIASFIAFTLPFDSDNASFTLGTLTLLIALLVGWQIYSIIDVQKQIEKANKVSKEIELFKEKIEIESKSALFVSLAQLGKSSFNKIGINKAYDNAERAEAVQSLFNALCLWQEEMDDLIAKDAYKYCTTKLQILIHDIKIFEVESAEEKDAFIMAAMKTDIRKLIDFATSIIVKKKE